MEAIRCPHCGGELSFAQEAQPMKPDVMDQFNKLYALRQSGLKLWWDTYEPKSQFCYSPAGFFIPLIIGLIMTAVGVAGGGESLLSLVNTLVGFGFVCGAFYLLRYGKGKEDSLRKEALAKMRTEHQAEYGAVFNYGGPD